MTWLRVTGLALVVLALAACSGGDGGWSGSVTDSAGVGLVSSILPAGAQYVGTTLYAQAIVYAQTVNPLQFVTSLGRQTTVCGPLGVARVFKFYNGAAVPAPSPPDVGTRTLGVGLVIEVY